MPQGTRATCHPSDQVQRLTDDKELSQETKPQLDTHLRQLPQSGFVLWFWQEVESILGNVLSFVLPAKNMVHTGC